MGNRFKVMRGAVAVVCAAAIAVMGLPVCAFASSGQVGDTFAVDGIRYMITGEGEVSVGNGIAEVAADHAVAGAAVVIPQTVSDGGVTYTVTSVARFAFKDDHVITSVTFPSTVKSIGVSAFEGCGSMDDSSDKPRYSGLEHIYFSGKPGLRYIGDYAFKGCYNLQTLTIPASVESLGTSSFSDCLSFDELVFEKDTKIKTLGMCAFEITWKDGFVKPKGLTDSSEWDSMGLSFVAGESTTCYADIDFTEANASSKVYGGLKRIVIPASVESIGLRAFANQRVLTDIEFESDTIEFFDSYVFAFCTSLEEVTLPAVGHMNSPDEGYTIGLSNHLFTCCTNLKTVTFGGEVRAPSGRRNGLKMFDGCRNLTKVVYNYNKIIPTKEWVFGYNYVYYGFETCDPTLYYRVPFASSREGALKGEETLGWATLREGVTSSQIKGGMESDGSDEPVVLRGVVPQVPDGYDAWSFVNRKSGDALSANEGIDDNVCAYPVKKSDLSFGDVVLSEDTVWYDGTEHKPEAVVIDAAGTPLEDSEYSLTWERQGGDGSWSPTSDFASAGSLRVAVQGLGSRFGTMKVEFTIAYLEKGLVFDSDGITYMVSKSQTSSSPAELQVGDGESCAVDRDAEGKVIVPASVRIPGSSLDVLVTSIGAKAFGSDSSESSCASITEVELPEGIESIGEMSFANMGQLKGIVLPATLKSIGTSAFKQCTSLASLVFAGESIERIGTDAFAYCTRLKTLELPAVTKSMLGLAFQNCVMLNSVTFKGGVNGQRLSQFNGCNRISAVQYQGSYWDYDWPAGTKVSASAGSGASAAVYSVIVGKKAATYVCAKSAAKKLTVPSTVKLGSKSYVVSAIAAGAFKNSKATGLLVQSTSLAKRSVKNSLKGSKVKTVKVPKSKVSAYKKCFTKSNCGASVTVSK